MGFIGNVAVVVSAATHGIDEIGRGKAFAAAGFAVWMLLNLALLSQLRDRKSPNDLAHSGNEDAASANDIVLAPRSEATGDVVFTPIAASDERFPQFSLRSLFVLAILVALACAIGTQPIAPSKTWRSSWGGTAGGKPVLWSVHVVSSRAGVPAIGYLWRAQGEKASSPMCFDVSASADYFAVNGRPVTPGRNFILFYNDADDQPQRLEMSKEEAMRVFGSQKYRSRIEEFWQETIEPLRKTPEAKSGSRRSALFYGASGRPLLGPGGDTGAGWR